MVAQPYLIEGAVVGDTQPRLEINDLQKDPIQFSLFIRALNRLLNKKSEFWELPNYVQSPTSWWQLGGIHGRPYEPWAGDPNGPQKPADPKGWGGYCYHDAALFPTWHRVQILLVEQAVVREAIDIASQPWFPPNWVEAATKLRFPFWDWTSDQTIKEGILKIFQEPRIWIARPMGGDEEVTNPLNHYRFPENHKPGPVDPGQGVWSRTFRWVNFNREKLLEDYGAAQKAFSKGGGPYGERNVPVSGLRKKVAGLFNYPLDPGEYGPNLWGRFSTTGSRNVFVPSKWRYETLPSIEDPHNSVHLDIGGIGTMSSLSYAGFDPLFYLHHANVDRIYAFWEWLYPNHWIANRGWRTSDGKFAPFRNAATFSQAGGSEIIANTDLVPFRFQDGSYWNSERARGLSSASETPKYYTYPKIIEGNVEIDVSSDNRNLTEEQRETIRQILYNHWATPLRTDVDYIQKISKDRGWDSRDSPLRGIFLEESEESETSYLRNFVVVGEIPQFAFPGSYRLELYLPPSDSNPGWLIDEISVLGRADPDECANCRARQAAGSIVRGHMHLDLDFLVHLILWNWPVDGHFPETSSLDWLVGLIKAKLRLRLAAPDGTRYAHTEELADTDEGHPLHGSKIPQVKLHSHRIWFNKNDLPITARTRRKGYISLGLHETEDHGEFESAWNEVGS